jgi:Putative GTPase activating protein for Arf
MSPSNVGNIYAPLHMESTSTSLLEVASAELEHLRLEPGEKYHSFPKACLSLLKFIEGNAQCVDCGSHDPQWASVSYGAILCLKCSGRHRSLGVQVSSVRSLTMDNWSHLQVLALLEGGNSQLLEFFRRHKLCPESQEDTSFHALHPTGPITKGPITKDNVTIMRYKTKAAQFYRQQLLLHVKHVLNSGDYKGREASRRLRHREFTSRNSSGA